MKNLILALLAIVSVASCTSVPSTNVGKAQPSISNSDWVLANNVQGKTPTLTIEGDKVSGNAGCNNYFGSLELDASQGVFKTSKLASTKMYCNEGMKVEFNYMDLLAKVDHYVVNGNMLELYSGNLLLVKFRKK